MRALKGSFFGSIYLHIYVFAILCLVLDIKQLPFHDVKLCVTDAHRFLSLQGVGHCRHVGASHGSKIEKEAELVARETFG